MEQTDRILNREEIAQEDKWAIEDLYPTDEAWEEALLTLKEDQKVLAAYKGRMTASAENLLSYLTIRENVEVKASRLGNYCMRRADEDTRNSFYQAMEGKFMAVMVSLEASTSFETPLLMALSDETMEAYYQERPQLERYRRYLNEIRRLKAHSLSEEEEKLLAAAGEMAKSPSGIYGAFADADIKFADAIDSQGNAHQVNQGRFVPLQGSEDQELRRSAYESLYDGFGDYRNTAAAILNAQNKQLKFFAEARKYDSAFQAALSRTNVPTDVYLNLIESVHKHLPKMHRYIRLRKKMLGVDELHFYDIYTSLVPGVDKHIPYAEAKQTVYDAMFPLGDGYRAVLKEGFENRWVDVYQNVGKRGGAYSAGAEVHPFVLMNYNGTLDNEFTLAHEMGHALHSYFSRKNQIPVDANYVIFVAEVASTFNESLLNDYLLNRATDKRERAYLINHFLERFKGTIYRQTLFAEFELNIGKMIAQGQTLTADVLCQEYKRLNELYYGPDIVVDDRIALEWARIPHFYYNYYVFQYSTGFAAAIALSRKVLAGEEGAVERYLNFLSGGCSKSPIDLLKDAGVDMTSPEPVELALELFDQLMDEMEALLEE